MRAHPTLGVQILKKAEGISPLARAVVRSHHERWNGTGYPDRPVGRRRSTSSPGSRRWRTCSTR